MGLTLWRTDWTTDWLPTADYWQTVSCKQTWIWNGLRKCPSWS